MNIKLPNGKRFLKILLVSLLATACGQRNDGENYGFSINSKFINITSEITDPNHYISIDAINETSQNLNTRSKENVLFRPPYRPTNLKYGSLGEGILGLTECEYRSNGTSNCTITLSHVINPDTATNEIQREARRRALVGVLRHEIGHAFGMGHIKDNENHVMYPYFRSKHLEEENIVLFVNDLTNFRQNGPASGLPPISIK